MTAPADAAAAEAARFLRLYPPFASLPEEVVTQVAAAAALQRLPAQTTIFAQGDTPLEHLWVIRDGAVEIVSEGRVLDLLGAGELFGHASMLSGLPPGFEARAAEDSICYRIDATVAEGLIQLGGGTLGILTDRDLRTRVLAAGLPGDAPVSMAMSAPAYTCTADRSAGEALLEMLDRGLRHLPVLSAAGSVLGVVQDVDLISSLRRTQLREAFRAVSSIQRRLASELSFGVR